MGQLSVNYVLWKSYLYLFLRPAKEAEEGYQLSFTEMQSLIIYICIFIFDENASGIKQADLLGSCQCPATESFQIGTMPSGCECPGGEANTV